MGTFFVVYLLKRIKFQIVYVVPNQHFSLCLMKRRHSSLVITEDIVRFLWNECKTMYLSKKQQQTTTDLLFNIFLTWGNNLTFFGEGANKFSQKISSILDDNEY